MTDIEVKEGLDRVSLVLERIAKDHAERQRVILCRDSGHSDDVKGLEELRPEVQAVMLVTRVRRTRRLWRSCRGARRTSGFL